MCVRRPRARHPNSANIRKKCWEPYRSDALEAWRARILIPVGIAAGIDRRVLREQALAGNVVHFEPDPVRILENDEIVAGRPVTPDRPAIDEGAHRTQLGRDLVDILARAGTQAEVMEADA